MTANKDVQLCVQEPNSTYVGKDVDKSGSTGSMRADGMMQIDTTSGSLGAITQDPSIKRNATWMDILYHSITAMVGAGVSAEQQMLARRQCQQQQPQHTPVPSLFSHTLKLHPANCCCGCP